MTTLPIQHRLQRGITMIESLLATTVAALAVGTTVPGLSAAIETRRIEGAAAQLETDLQFARGAAVAHNRSVRVAFEAGAGASCYVVFSGAAGDCSCSAGAAPVCRTGALAVRSARFDAGTAVQVASNSPSMVFDAMKGTVTPTATLRVTGARQAVHVVVNLMGRARTCSPSGLAGYPRC